MVERIIELTRLVGDEITEEMKSDKAQAAEDAAFTTNEREQGFPHLHAYTLVGMWGALEAGVEDMLVGILLHEPALLLKPEFGKIRIPFAKFEELDKEERMRFLLSEVQRGESSGLAQGVTGFENVLQVFDLSGPVTEEIRKPLWEMNHTRNVTVHRDLRADLRLIQACPWVNLKVGDRIFTNHAKVDFFLVGVVNYLIVLVGRLGARYGAPLPKWAREPFPIPPKLG
jgi:hypothetical protein